MPASGLLRSLLADTTPLEHPHFRRLWTANIITVIGAQLNIIVVPLQIYDITDSSAYVGLAGAFGLVPLVIFGLYGGALSDRMDRTKLLRITTVGMIVTAVAFWAQAASGLDNVWLLLCVFAVQQAFFAVNQPTRTAVIARIVPLGKIGAATSLNMTVTQAGAILGPILGGLLVPVTGFAWLYLIDAVCLLSTLWAVLKLPAMPPTDAASSGKDSGKDAAGDRGGFRSVLDGFVYLWAMPLLLMSFLVDIIAMTFGMPRALIPEISTVDFGESGDGGLFYALLLAAMPAGAVLGGVFSGAVTRARRQGLGIVVSVICWGAAIIVMGLAVTFADGQAGLWAWVAVISFLVGGTADMFSSVQRNAMLQEAADDRMRGRLQGVFLIVVAGGPRLADMLHGWIGSWIGAGPATAIGGVLVIVGVLIAVASVPAFLRYVPARFGVVDSSADLSDTERN
ncbi:MFS transporter [Corynebacterium variabile]|uniref:Multidrug efflux pump Tap n=1 Tax=Corynebacterium variabile TaxID=1727 RepID=A0A4Y4C3K7_9CORY|nr:MFS transporter [Corynebacterium variabile]MDN6662350.1 MFS transporter [Corynebacterium variabile]GEC87611.1 MFS transporter [Corynebacterium variabile]